MAKKTNFEPYPKHAVVMVTDFQYKSVQESIVDVSNKFRLHVM
jgi:hypothetical protein